MLGFFSANSHPKVDREWPNWNLESSEVELYVPDWCLSERDHKKFNDILSGFLPLLVQIQMDQILPAGLQHDTRVGWARNQSVVHGRGAGVATSSPKSPPWNRTVHVTRH